MEHQHPDMQACIDDCLQCHERCLQDAMNHCLESGGAHVEPEHFRLMMNCAEMCRTAAHFMLSSSSLHAKVCATCADVCEACARSCEQLDDMSACAAACRRCAASCRRMSQAAAGVHAFEGSQREAASFPVKAPM